MDQQPMQTPSPSAPVETPQSGGSMKWLLIVLGVVIVVAAIYWFTTR
ncbi:MAG: hypothetical protein Q7K11_00575 [Candidatus Berkelbacteria bacterium]|nr:hypothetical protein [Candidatus Berkelbacteria bacterium]